MNPIAFLVGAIGDMPRSRRAAIAWGYCGLLVYLLISPSPLAPFGEWGLDTEHAFDRTLSSYVEHVIAYVGLISVFWWSYRPASARAKSWLLGGACLHGAVFEGLQHFVPARYCDWPDFFCDLAGVALGAGLVQVLLSWEKSIGHSPPEAANGSPRFPKSITFGSRE